MSQTESPDDSDDQDIFKELYEKHGDALEDLAADDDDPAAPLARMVCEEATGGTDED